MYRILIILLLAGFTTSCHDSWHRDLSRHEKQLVRKALRKADDNKKELKIALTDASHDEKQAMAFLIGYMPERDLKCLSAEFLMKNVDKAFQAREKFKWCAALPDSIFYNDVLPYAVLSEKRQCWREDFYNWFEPLVKKAPDIRAAVDSVNRHIKDVLKVEYNTKRKKVDQAPYESIHQGMATCTGLSILLVDAFRSVGIPARIAGTPMWTNMRGNHTWVEVWIDGKWYFTEYYMDALNKSWFLADAGKADPEQPEHCIYATSYKPTGMAYPLVWDEQATYVHGVDVTQRYIDLYRKQMADKQLDKDELWVRVVLLKDPKAAEDDSNNRVHEKITVTQNGEPVDFGFSPSPTDDLNRLLPFRLKKETTYQFEYMGKDSTLVKKTLTTGTSDQEMLRLYM